MTRVMVIGHGDDLLRFEVWPGHLLYHFFFLDPFCNPHHYMRG